MILNIAVVALVLGLGYVWMLRGFFNAMLHMVAVIVGGAVAFAAWEPLSLALVNASPTAGFGRFLGSVAWGAGLILPFAATTIIVRVALDKLIPANVTLARPVEYAGGAVCGLATGLLAVGIGVIGFSSIRFEARFLGYQPLWYNQDRLAGGGTLRLNDSLWLPADRITGRFYSALSRRAFGSSQPLATWYPDLHAVAYASRIAPDDTAPRNAYKPSDFKVIRRYTVGDASGGTPLEDLLAFEQAGQMVAQRYADPRGEPVGSGRIEGFVLEMSAGAKDPGKKGAGQVVFSNGQARLVFRDANGETFNAFPVAMISQASSGESAYGRWRYEADNDFFASVGGASTVPLALEFVVPAGAEPIGLFVKGVRVEAADMPAPTAYASVRERDAIVASGGILRGEASAPRELDASSARTVDPGAVEGISAVNTLGRGRLLHKQVARRGFDIDDDNRITGGQALFERRDFDNPPQDRNLRVDKFAVSRDQVIVQIQAGQGQPADLLSPAARLINTDLPLRLIDANGQAYDAVGYIYEDDQGVDIRYTPGDPLSGTEELPALSGSRTDQQVTLVFLSSLGVEIRRFAIGDTVLLEFDPPLVLDKRQG